MARINIEECWWSDPRRSKLARLLQSEDLADGRAVRMWRLAQEFWQEGRQLVPLHIFETLESWEQLIESRLAEVRGEFVYVRGSSQWLDWTHEEKAKRVRGGKNSAKRPRDARGRLLPANTPASVQVTASCGPGEPSNVQVSGSGSGSKEIIYPGPEDLEKAISIEAKSRFAKKYPDPQWLKEQIEFCHAYHLADETKAPRTKGQWMQKLETWLHNSWAKKQAETKLHAVPDTGGWGHIDGVS